MHRRAAVAIEWFVDTSCRHDSDDDDADDNADEVNDDDLTKAVSSLELRMSVKISKVLAVQCPKPVRLLAASLCREQQAIARHDICMSLRYRNRNGLRPGQADR